MKLLKVILTGATVLALCLCCSCARKTSLDVAVKSVLDINAATAIRNTIHPTGLGGSITSIDIRPDGSGVEANISISWRGGVTGRPYVTLIVWRLNSMDHLGSVVLADDCPIPIVDARKQALDNYLRGLMPLIRAKMGKTQDSKEILARQVEVRTITCDNRESHETASTETSNRMLLEQKKAEIRDWLKSHPGEHMPVSVEDVCGFSSAFMNTHVLVKSGILQGEISAENMFLAGEGLDVGKAKPSCAQVRGVYLVQSGSDFILNLDFTPAQTEDIKKSRIRIGDFLEVKGLFKNINDAAIISPVEEWSAPTTAAISK